MRAFLTVAATTAALASLAATAHAQPAAKYSEHDMQCFIAASAAADGAEDAETKNSGTMAAMYFAGKIYGANAKVDFTAALDAESTKIADADMTALLKTCADELQASGSAIEAAGKALAEKSK
jgi:hypothetical protein